MSTASHLSVVVDTPHACELHIDQIRIEERHRTELGDIKALADSINTIGLVHPVVVTPDHRLIAGERRIAAMRSLGWETIPVTVIHTLADATDRLLAERDENTCRKDFTASELVIIGRRIEELERPKAQERQREAGRLGGRAQGERLGSTEPNLGKKTDKVVGEALGVTESKYKRAKTVVKATEDADPVVRDVAREQLAKLDAGETSYSAADQAVRDARIAASKPIEEPVVKPDLPTKIHGPKPDHQKILNRIVVGLSGTVMTLADIEADGLNDTVNAEEALRLSKDLSQSIRALNRIKRLLEERTK